jgi:hypothetical protein
LNHYSTDQPGQFVTEILKTELHLHLEGAVSLKILIEIFAKKING